MSGWENFKKFYKVFRWVMLAVIVVVLLLVMKQAPPPEVQTNPHAAEKVNFKVHQAQQAVATGEAHTLELDEAELNTLLRQNLALMPLQAAVAAAEAPPAEQQPTLEEMQSNVRDVRVQLVGDKVAAYLLFDFHGKDLTLTLEGTLHVVDGYLRLQPTGGALGSLPIPQTTMDNAVRRLFDSPENKEKFRMPPEISDVRVEGGQIRIFYNQ